MSAYPFRWFACLLCVLLLGCGGGEEKPGGDKPAPGEEQPADIEQPADENSATTDATAKVGAGEVDPAWMVEGFQVALVARPAELFQEKLITDTVAVLPPEAVGDLTEGMREALGQGPENLEHLVVLQGLPTENSFGPVFAGRLQFKEPIDPKKLLELNEDAQEAEHNGKKYWRVESEFTPEVRTFHLSEDGKTLIMTTEDFLKPILDGNGGSTVLGKLAAGADYSGDVTLLVAVEPARPTIKAMLSEAGEDIPRELRPLVSLVDKVSTAELQLNLTEGDLLKGKLSSVDGQSAQEAKSTLEALLVLGETLLGQGKQQVPPDAQEVVLPAMAVAEEMLKTAKFEAEGSLITFTLPRPAGFNEKLTQFRDDALAAAKKGQERLRPMNDLRMVLLALHNHAATFGKLPAQAILSEDGQPLSSWRVAMLPYLEEAALYDKFDRASTWDSEANRALSETSLEVFRTSDDVPAGMSNIMAVVADDSVIDAKKQINFSDIQDGMSNTIVLVEVEPAKAVPWAKPADWTPDANNPTAGLKIHDDGKFIVGFADGSVRRLDKNIDPKTLLAMFTKSGGEVVSPDEDEFPGEDAADDAIPEDAVPLDEDVPFQEESFENRENEFERNEEFELDPQDRLDENLEPAPAP